LTESFHIRCKLTPMTELAQAPTTATAVVTTLRVEHLAEAIGIGEPAPRVSWLVEGAPDGWAQAAYELEARGESVSVSSGESSLVAWPFAPLESREQVDLRVRVTGDDGSVSAWSAPQPVEAGLLRAADWQAHFVTPDLDEDTTRPQPCPQLRHEFDVRGPVTRARLYVTALGVYEAYVNGTVVGDDVLAPGWTSYGHRLCYRTFDVAHLLREGRNAVGAILGDGWYRGRLGFHGGRRNIYGDELALLAQLEIEYADGTGQIVVTDRSWRAGTGPILASDLYDGETHDARLELDGWAEPGFSESALAGVRVVERDLSTLTAPVGAPIRRTQLVAPVDVTTSPSGRTIVDFGQNLVGRLRLTVEGPAGRTITVRHAEVLEDGELCTRPLRDAAATDRYTLRGRGPETWEPRFTLHGFRYVDVEGWPGEVAPDAIWAVVCHSDLERVGWFDCSDPLLNQLHENVVWSMRGNFVSVPTDCPQRDERLGWTGDIQVFAPTACFLYDSAGFLDSWLADLAAEQGEDGRVPNVVPDVLPLLSPGHAHAWHAPTAGWGDAAVLVPWVVYERYGDTALLVRQFDSMRKWVDLVTSVAGDDRLWDSGFQWGDWLDPSAPPDRPHDGLTDTSLVATAYFARTAAVLAAIAGVLDRAADAERYALLAEEVRDAFDRAYGGPNGTLVQESPTGYALALQFGLMREPERRRLAGERLAELVRQNGYHIATGFLGTPLICDALCSVGEFDTAYRLLLQRECPSWLYPATMGATTIWERWDSMLPDGSVNPGGMTSFNHYAFGAIADWLHRTVAGLSPAAPGYRRLEIRPVPGGGLTYASARHRSPFGLAESSWRIEDGRLELRVVVPSGTTAAVTVPGTSEGVDVGPGTHRWSVDWPAGP
jgi:alpha-L-rhamnosidase